ncbi:hypothetical protein B0O99DRAFT_685514 [Bisporella sp. PMI_857]|nr:hypothetical protein B0O99DRAFT_685514 [Bisporella sp. PMI_857]
MPTLEYESQPWEPLTHYHARIAAHQKLKHQFEKANTSRGYNVPRIITRVVRVLVPASSHSSHRSNKSEMEKLKSKKMYIASCELMWSFRVKQEVKGQLRETAREARESLWENAIQMTYLREVALEKEIEIRKKKGTMTSPMEMMNNDAEVEEFSDMGRRTLTYTMKQARDVGHERE